MSQCSLFRITNIVPRRLVLISSCHLHADLSSGCFPRGGVAIILQWTLNSSRKKDVGLVKKCVWPTSYTAFKYRSNCFKSLYGNLCGTVLGRDVSSCLRHEYSQSSFLTESCCCSCGQRTSRDLEYGKVMLSVGTFDDVLSVMWVLHIVY
jgi:hypothetical protein